MKRVKFLSIAIIAVILMSVASFNSCSDMLNNPLKDKETGDDITLLLLDLNFFDTSITLEFVDNETDAIIDQEITAYVVGDKAQHLVTQSGEHKESYNAGEGSMELFLDPNYTISEASPLQLEVVAYSDSYISLPLTIEITEAGQSHITVRMVDIMSTAKLDYNLKSASAINASEPFNVIVNNAAAFDTIKSIDFASYFNDNIQYFKLYKLNVTPEVLTWERLCKLNIRTFCDKLNNYNKKSLDSLDLYAVNILDTSFYDDWGFKVLDKNNFEDTVHFTKPSDNYYSAVKYTDYEKCAKGHKIIVRGTTGSGQFRYKITYSDGRFETGKIVGVLGGDSTSFTRTIQPIFYPSEDKNITVELFGNGQYDIKNPVQTSRNPCNTSNTFTVTAKTGLSRFHIVSKYSCENNATMALTLSTSNIRFRESKPAGTTPNSWEYFSMSQGIADLWMKTKTEYDFSVLINNKWESYSIPTDTSRAVIDKFIADIGIASEDYDIKTFTATSKEAGVIILDINVLLKNGICDKF